MAVARNVTVPLSGAAKVLNFAEGCSSLTLTNVSTVSNPVYVYFREPAAYDTSVSATKYHYRLYPGDTLTVLQSGDVELFASTATVEACFRSESACG